MSPPEDEPTGQGVPGLSPGRPQGLALTANLCNVFAEAGCPLASLTEEGLRFEAVLAERSATYHRP
jgi:hypothetical protein